MAGVDEEEERGTLLFGPLAHAAAEAKVYVWVEAREGNIPILKYSQDSSTLPTTWRVAMPR